MKLFIKIKKLIIIVVVNIIIFLGLFSGLELIARYFNYPDDSKLFSNRTHGIHKFFVKRDPHIGFVLIPNYASPQININSMGFRGKEFDNDLNKHFVILAIGGSTTFGLGVDDSQSYPYQLQTILRNDDLIREKNIKLTVVNAGVPSYTSIQQRLHLEASIKLIKPDLVLICTGTNDYLYSTLVNWYPEVLLLRIPSPWRLWFQKNSALFRLLIMRPVSSKKLVNVFNDEALNYFSSNIEAMIDTSTLNNIEVTAVAPPFNNNLFFNDQFSPFNDIIIHKPEFARTSQRKFWEALVEIGKKENINLIDHKMSVTHFTDKKYFLDFCHLTPEGHFLMASDIAQQIRQTVALGKLN